MDQYTLGSRIRSLRAARGLTKKDLADAAWIEIDSYNRYERGTRCMSVTTLDRLCKVLKTTPNDLMGYDDSPHRA